MNLTDGPEPDLSQRNIDPEFIQRQGSTVELPVQSFDVGSLDQPEMSVRQFHSLVPPDAARIVLADRFAQQAIMVIAADTITDHRCDLRLGLIFFLIFFRRSLRLFCPVISKPLDDGGGSLGIFGDIHHQGNRQPESSCQLHVIGIVVIQPHQAFHQDNVVCGCRSGQQVAAMRFPHHP